MSYEISTASSAEDLLNKLNTFLTANGKAYDPSYTGTGNGTISAWDGGASSVAETFTLTATSATEFTVVGSVSGSLGTATVGTPFSHAKLAFTLTAGTTAFVAGDKFLINTAPKWANLRSVAGSEMIWEAAGNDGTREIITGALLFSDAGADYYNWRLGGFNGYSSGVAFASQPGFLGVPGPVIPLWDTTIPYWFVANGQRVIVVAKIGSTYVHAYLGLITSYLDPGAWPLPLMVGGAMAWATEPAVGSSNWRYSYSGAEAHSYWRGRQSATSSGDTNNSGRLRLPSGEYLGLSGETAATAIGSGRAGSLWPFACDSGTSGSRGFEAILPNLDGSYPLLPITLSSDRGTTAGQDAATWGEFDGVMATTGQSNASENTIAVGGLTWVVFQDGARTNKDCFCAVALN